MSATREMSGNRVELPNQLPSSPDYVIGWGQAMRDGGQDSGSINHCFTSRSISKLSLYCICPNGSNHCLRFRIKKRAPLSPSVLLAWIALRARFSLPLVGATTKPNSLQFSTANPPRNHAFHSKPFSLQPIWRLFSRCWFFIEIMSGIVSARGVNQYPFHPTPITLWCRLTGRVIRLHQEPATCIHYNFFFGTSK